VICREVQEEIATAMLTGADLDEGTSTHIATCPECAAEQASLRQVLVVMGTATAADVSSAPTVPGSELHLRRILDAASAEREHEQSRTRVQLILVAAAAVVVVILGVGVGIAVSGPDHVITASASAAGLSATADIAPARDGSELTIAVRGVPLDTDCVLLVRTSDGRTQTIVEWRAEYLGTAHVSGTADASPDAITNVTLTKANGAVLLDIPVTT